MVLRRKQLGFGGRSAPAPQVVPIAPQGDSNVEAEAERAKAAAQAAAAAAASGRASTIRAGASIAAENQMQRGLLKKAQRDAAASELLG